MSAVIQKNGLSEVLFPCAYAYHTIFPVMVTKTDEGDKHVCVPVSGRTGKRILSVVTIFPEKTVSEIKFLPVSFPWLVDFPK